MSTKPGKGPRGSLINILLFFTGYFLTGLVFVLWYGLTWDSLPIAGIWMMATLMAGAALGFLFGIPKILQGGSAGSGAPRADYQMHVNTNLTEISDWLTKIIVGLSLVNLGKIAPYITNVARAFAGGIRARDAASALAFAYGVIVCYFILGFLFGYLLTRLVLSKAFSEVDRSVNEQNQYDQSVTTNIVSTVNSKIQSDCVVPPEAGDANAAKPSDSEVNVQDKQAAIDAILAAAKIYPNISDPDYTTRIQKKDEAVAQMTALASKNGISKQEIKSLFDGNDQVQGLISVLATQIIVNPELDDDVLLISVAGKATYLHIRYRVLLAFDRLAERHLLMRGAATTLREIIVLYSSNADSALAGKIAATLAKLPN